MSMQLNWFEPGLELNPAEMANAEKQLQVRFPADYAQMVATHSGGSNPDECEFVYFSQGKERIGNFGYLLGLRNDQDDTVFDAISDLEEQIPPGIVPIIGTGSGDYICLDYRYETKPSIIYFAHEKTGGDSLIPLDSTFTEFLQRLKIPEDD